MYQVDYNDQIYVIRISYTSTVVCDQKESLTLYGQIKTAE